ncbi:MAG TPA: OB-fold nucleic acid binding domain-containing protein [Beijerinckiaceae bacterium]|nr:OB-fold nucleic acid binding domain-containing protein [Beijerinckiaceae bacterium]
MKCRYPDVFACALLNAQPMGFYAPAQIVRDAREHGVEVREVDVNFSVWDSTLEPPILEGKGASLHPRHASMREDMRASHALRLGFRQISGVREEDMRRLAALRGRGYDSVRDLWLRSGLSPTALEGLAEADAFRSIGLDRRGALWAVRGINRSGDKDDLPLFRCVDPREQEPDARLPPMPLGEHVVEDYRHLSLSLKAHPVAFLRQRLAARGVLKAEDLARMSAAIPLRRDKGPRATVAGLVLVRQRPGSASGVVFLTLEDETGIANVIVWPKVFERQRAMVIGARFVAVTGPVQNEAGVVHVIAEKFEDLTSMLGLLSQAGENVSALARADEVRRPQTREKPRPRETPLFDRLVSTPEEGLAPAPQEVRRVMPKGRNFH